MFGSPTVRGAARPDACHRPAPQGGPHTRRWIGSRRRGGRRFHHDCGCADPGRRRWTRRLQSPQHAWNLAPAGMKPDADLHGDTGAASGNANGGDRRVSRALRYGCVISTPMRGSPCRTAALLPGIDPPAGRAAPHQHAVRAEPGRVRLPARDETARRPITSARSRTRRPPDHMAARPGDSVDRPTPPLHAITTCGSGAPAVGIMWLPPRGAQCEMPLAAAAPWRLVSGARRWRPRLRRLQPTRSVPDGPSDASSGGEHPRRT